MEQFINGFNSQCIRCGCVKIHSYDYICSFCGTLFTPQEVTDNQIGFLDNSDTGVTIAERKNVLKNSANFCMAIQKCVTVEENMRFVWNYEYLLQVHKSSHKVRYILGTLAAAIFGFPLMMYFIGMLAMFIDGEIGAASSLMFLLSVSMVLIMTINHFLLSPQLRFHKGQYMNAKKSLKTIGR